MKSLKRLSMAAQLLTVCLVALVIDLLATPARAQAQGNFAGVVNFISAGTLTNAATWSQGGIIKIDQNSTAALVVRFQGDGSATDNVIVTLARSGDGINFETSPPTTLKFTNALANTTAVVGFHQISPDLLRSAHSIKLVSVQNAATSVKGTNAYVGLAIKRNN